MHSRIFQISRNPIDKSDYINESDYYESSFIGTIADYVSDGVDRKEDIEWLKTYLKDVADFDGDSFTIKNQRKYFERNFNNFISMIKEMSLLTFEDFCKGENDFDYKMWQLENAYRNRFEFYVNSEYNGTEPFVDFMRQAVDGDVYYIGATIDYHF